MLSLYIDLIYCFFYIVRISGRTDILLCKLQNGSEMTAGEQVRLALALAFPSVVSQLVTIVMEYLDTAMVGQLGAAASASIGLVSTTTWLMGGLCTSLAGGFSVLVAQAIGARDASRARYIMRVAIGFTLVLSTIIGLAGVCMARRLPIWLGGTEEIVHDATVYFFFFAASLPVWEMSFLMSSMLRSAGNTVVPSVVNICECVLNVLFNYVFIFVFGLGVAGAAIGTLCSIVIGTTVLMVYVLCFSKDLKVVKGEWHGERGNRSAIVQGYGHVLKHALKIGVPMAVQQVAISTAQIMTTLIVAPLGTVAIASHTFGITIEGLCYMPGFGIGDAATTLIGQSIGAKREDLKRSFASITLLLGMGLMTVMGVFMFIGAPYLMPLMTPDTGVQQLTVEILRIEAFAEPFYAASIVAYCIFVGAGDTKLPALMNLFSIWVVRLPAAYMLAQMLGLKGVWIAMCGELCFRGLIFLFRLWRRQWFEISKSPMKIGF